MRYRLASPEWLKATRDVLQSCLDACVREGHDVSRLTFSICEVSQDPPADIGPAGSRVGWCCRVVAGTILDFQAGEAIDVDYRMVTDYESMRSMAAFDTEGDPARSAAYNAMTKALFDDGKIQIHGRMPALPRPFAAWHDAMAKQTA